MANLFKKNHLYGHILEFLNDRPDKRFDYIALCEHFGNEDKGYLLTQLKKLKRDGLVDVDELIRKRENSDGIGGSSQRVEIFGISHKGQVFLNELENTKTSRKMSIGSLLISLAALLVSIWAAYKQTDNSRAIKNLKETESPLSKISNDSAKNIGVKDTTSSDSIR